MTVSSTTRSTQYVGNGSTTSFSFAWRVFETTDVALVLTEGGVDTDITSNYTVVLNADQGASPGGTVTYPVSGSALTASQTLSILSAVPYTQGVDLENGGAFNAEVLEAAFDRATVQIQQLAELVGADTEPAPAEPDPLGDLLDAVDAETRANKALGFDGDGNLTVQSGFDAGTLTVSAFMETVLDDADAAAARATLGVPAIPATYAADDVTYTNTASGLTATTVQDALDEIDATLDQALEDIASGGVPAATLTTYTTAGTGTFTVPTGCNYIYAEVVGAGGGGGAGYAGGEGYGGFGGGAGECKRVLFRAPAAGTEITVTVGSGGSGGAATAAGMSGDVTGNAGSAGGVSGFGGYVVASGGDGGWGGYLGVPGYHKAAPTGGSAPGMGGGGGSTSDSSVQAAQAGGSSKGGQATITTVAGGTAGSGGVGGAGSSASTNYTYGGGGGGGAYRTSGGSAYAGGAGGTPGGGGGGGGALLGTSYNSGAGGTGARGEVRVWYW